MFLSEIRVVLSGVSESGNVGAVCRAMKNMGLSQLHLIPAHPLSLDTIRQRAVNANDIWENSRIFNSLEEAIADCSIVVGTTCRRGHKRKSISMTPHDLARWLAESQGLAAIVFGNERTGLETEELELCNFASHIPVSQACPSLNLSHAVQIYAYEFFMAMEKQRPVKGEWTPMNQAEIDSLTGKITDELADIGFYKKPNRDYQTRFLHDVIARAGLAEREGRYLGDIIVKAGRLGAGH
ncbi:MAG: RNA methyltransferase [Treponema sp.]|nr:RNA methyltransferase [Treponema sp.]